MHPLPLVRVLALAAVLATASCGTARGPASDPFAAPETGEEQGELRIVAQNQHFRDATLYARYDTERARMGVVGGGSTTGFAVEWPETRSLRIEIVLLGGEHYTTSSVLVSPGQRVRLIVTSPLRNSRIRR